MNYGKAAISTRFAARERPPRSQARLRRPHQARRSQLPSHGWTTHSFLPVPTCRGYLRHASGYITSREEYTLRTELPEYELRAHVQARNNWAYQVYVFISWPAFRSATAGFTDSLRTFVVKLSHGWLPIGVRERRCSATTDLCPQCNEIETVPHLYRGQARAPWRHRFLIHLNGHPEETHTAADIRCIILKVSRAGFSPANTKDPDSIESIRRSNRLVPSYQRLHIKRADFQ
jgi:hypothetical protein